MTCPICRTGSPRPGTATVTLERDGMTLVVRGVPAEVCDTCGEEHVAAAVATRLLDDAEDAARHGVKVAVRDYIAA